MVFSNRPERIRCPSRHMVGRLIEKIPLSEETAGTTIAGNRDPKMGGRQRSGSGLLKQGCRPIDMFQEMECHHLGEAIFNGRGNIFVQIKPSRDKTILDAFLDGVVRKIDSGGRDSIFLAKQQKQAGAATKFEHMIAFGNVPKHFIKLPASPKIEEFQRSVRNLIP